MSLAGRVVVFSITGCPFCNRAKKVLKDEYIPFADVNLEKYPDRRQEMQDRSGRRTVPQIFFNATHIGGCDDLIKLQQTGKLHDALQEVVNNPPPPDAPLPPPDQDQTDSASSHEIDEILLPSQKIGNPRECTPDEMAHLALEIREKSGLVKTHTYHLIQYKHCFVGQELVDWFMKKKGFSSRAEALNMGKELLRRHFINHVTFEHHFEDDYLFYRFVSDLKTKALNAQLSHSCLPRDANDVADDLRKLILEIYGDFLSEDGLAVDYEGIACSAKFERYVRLSAELKRVDLSQLVPAQKMAFFINVYNALVIHAFVVQGPPTNTLGRLRFYSQISYIIGGQVFSLNDIESGILRGNRKPVAAFRRPFSRHDPRLPVALSAPDPRIHFALVCGAKSCPPIKTYSPENVFTQLEVATQSFLEEGGACIVDMNKREVSLSTILKWYKEDFGSNKQAMLSWVAEHLPDGQKKENIKQLLQARSFSIKFIPYNWTLNSV